MCAGVGGTPVQSPRQVHHHRHVAAGGVVGRGGVFSYPLLPDPQYTRRPGWLDTLQVGVNACSEDGRVLNNVDPSGCIVGSKMLSAMRWSKLVFGVSMRTELTLRSTKS